MNNQFNVGDNVIHCENEYRIGIVAKVIHSGFVWVEWGGDSCWHFEAESKLVHVKLKENK